MLTSNARMMTSQRRNITNDAWNLSSTHSLLEQQMKIGGS